ncbi:iron uptake porin [Oscillatoria salina]|uniref:iron uptake porin n=1 Tax=Oscillatoria salina TaxID=331517 RepID=UPI001CCD44C0|nr:iron uptake porin [Oscillatoria salina]MBZ8178867.1 iron uptake porin [Oscillatoria salina IIICB1]
MTRNILATVPVFLVAILLFPFHGRARENQPLEELQAVTAREEETELISSENWENFDSNPTLDFSVTEIDTSELVEENLANETMMQVPSVIQLRDVRPTDWAFQALQNLVEEYACLVGYPDGTYRGNRAITRYEFAAGLNACLNQIEVLLRENVTNEGNPGIPTEDLEILRRLTQEFEAELATLGTRVDNLETQVVFLEENQFSTTTKLRGQVFLNLTGAFANGDIRAEGLNAFIAQRDVTGENVERVITDDPEITLSDYIFLTLNTSFSGRDNLVVQLAAGNGNSPANQFVSAGLFNTFGTPFTDQRGAPAVNNDIILREIFYDFPVGDRLRFVVGARVNWYRYFDNNAFTFFLTGASSFNSSGSTQLNSIDRGAGAVAIWNVTDNLTLRVGYLGENTEFLPSPPFNTASDPTQGLFGGTNTTTVQLDYEPSDNATLRFIYNRSNIEASNGLIGGAIAEPIYGFADDSFGGPVGDATADTFAFNFDWRLTRRFGIFGRYSYGSTNIFPLTSGRDDGEINAQSFQFGLAFPDLVKEGALGTLSFVIPFDVVDGRKFLISGGGDGATQFEVEATYFYPVTNNLALVPAFYIIGNPNNFGDNGTIYVGNLRAQFSF